VTAPAVTPQGTGTEENPGAEAEALHTRRKGGLVRPSAWHKSTKSKHQGGKRRILSIFQNLEGTKKTRRVRKKKPRDSLLTRTRTRTPVTSKCLNRRRVFFIKEMAQARTRPVCFSRKNPNCDRCKKFQALLRKMKEKLTP